VAEPRKRPLRAVSEGETKAPAKSVAQAAATGNHRELLVAMRDRIAIAVTAADCPPRDLASLTRRLQDIGKELEALDLRAKEEATEGGHVPDEAWDSEAL
jgi:hypothetical protein